jgi:hypothetical protein
MTTLATAFAAAPSELAVTVCSNPMSGGMLKNRWAGPDTTRKAKSHQHGETTAASNLQILLLTPHPFQGGFGFSNKPFEKTADFAGSCDKTLDGHVAFGLCDGLLGVRQ